MKKINKSKFAILGLLFDKPRSGYEMRQFMLESTDHFWQESDASMYPMLKLLEQEGLITGKSEFVGKRERKLFEITQSGKDEFLAWMAKPAEKENRRSEFLLKIFLGATVSKEEIIKQLALRQQKLQESKKRFESIEAGTLAEVADEHPHKIFWHMALRYGVISVDAELQWLEECLKILEKK
jgi:DNA-binding PadR family transcriptional regulator